MTGAADTVQLAPPQWLDAAFPHAGKIAVVGTGDGSVVLAALLARASAAGTLAGEPAVVLVRPRQVRGARSAPHAALAMLASPRTAPDSSAPSVAELVDEALRTGLLRESRLYEEVRDADAIVLCAETGWTNGTPDYTDMLGALNGIIGALRVRPPAHVPLVVFGGLLAPSSMATVIHDRFAANGMRDGEHISLGNTPPRTPNCGVASRNAATSIAETDMMLGGTTPAAPPQLERLYRGIVTRGTLARGSSLAVEVASCAEAAWRDVRIALASEIARYTDVNDIDFRVTRRLVNERLHGMEVPWCDARVTPTGALLRPTVGVGGHKLPIAAQLLRWRELEQSDAGGDSVMLRARQVNNASPVALIAVTERALGSVAGRRVTVLGAAYRPDVADTCRSPALVLASELLARECSVRVHDPYLRASDAGVRAAEARGARFTGSLQHALHDAEVAIVCVAHRLYAEMPVEAMLLLSDSGMRLVDGCTLYSRAGAAAGGSAAAAVGRGRRYPEADLVDFVVDAFAVVERSFANELRGCIGYLNKRFGDDDFNQVSFHKVQQLMRSNPLGYPMADYGAPVSVSPYRGWIPSLCL